jgi:hypothetical protein
VQYLYRSQSHRYRHCTRNHSVCTRNSSIRVHTHSMYLSDTQTHTDRYQCACTPKARDMMLATQHPRCTNGPSFPSPRPDPTCHRHRHRCRRRAVSKLGIRGRLSRRNRRCSAATRAMRMRRSGRDGAWSEPRFRSHRGITSEDFASCNLNGVVDSIISIRWMKRGTVISHAQCVRQMLD